MFAPIHRFLNPSCENAVVASRGRREERNGAPVPGQSEDNGVDMRNFLAVPGAQPLQTDFRNARLSRKSFGAAKTALVARRSLAFALSLLRRSVSSTKLPLCLTSIWRANMVRAAWMAPPKGASLSKVLPLKRPQ